MRTLSASILFVSLSLVSACVPTVTTTDDGQNQSHLSKPAQPEKNAGASATGSDSCTDLIECDNQCSDSACELACIKKTSPAAWQAYKALSDCIAVECPSPVASGTKMAACRFDAKTGQPVDAAACSACLAEAQTTGACVQAVATCNQDAPSRPDVDGGSGSAGPGVDLAIGAVGTASCADLLACYGNCATAACDDQCVRTGTATAQASYNALSFCVLSTCGSGNPAPCALDSTGQAFANPSACDACENDAQLTNGPCAALLDACASS